MLILVEADLCVHILYGVRICGWMVWVLRATATVLKTTAFFAAVFV
jgi:hypothetical protein